MKSILITILLFSSVLIAYSYKKVVVDVSKQMAYAYEGKKLIYAGWASTGKKKYQTPIGKYKILAKEKEHISNEWPKPNGGAKMPYMLRLTWSGIALHSGYTPNYPASHGCVRLQKNLAKNIFNWASIGTRVIIKGKTPKRVARRGKSFINYISNKKNSYRRVAKKDAKKRLSKKDRRIAKYSKYSHKRLNRLLKASYRKKNIILKSKKLTKKAKIRKLKTLRRELLILKAAKNMKYKRYKRHHKRLANKPISIFKNGLISGYNLSISSTINLVNSSKSFGHLTTL